MSQELAKVQVASLSQYDKQTLDTIKGTIAKGASDHQLAMFLTLAGKYGLDPFAKEIYLANIGGTPTIIVGRDGYLKIAQRDPNFQGINSGVVRSTDEFEIDTLDGKVIHRPNFAERGKIVGAWAIVYHKERKPAVIFADFDEYNSKSGPWVKYPSAMIEKVAQSRALKMQFGISGLVTEDEIGNPPAPVQQHANATEVEEQPVEVEQPMKFKRGMQTLYDEALNIVQDLCEARGMDPAKAASLIELKATKDFSKGIYDLTKKDWERIIEDSTAALNRTFEAQPEPEIIPAAAEEVPASAPGENMSFEEAKELFSDAASND